MRTHTYLRADTNAHKPHHISLSMNLFDINIAAFVAFFFAITSQIVRAHLDDQSLTHILPINLVMWFEDDIIHGDSDALIKAEDGQALSIYKHFGLLGHELMRRAGIMPGLEDLTEKLGGTKVGIQLLNAAEFVVTLLQYNPNIEVTKATKSIIISTARTLASKLVSKNQGCLRTVMQDLTRQEPVESLFERSYHPTSNNYISSASTM